MCSDDLECNLVEDISSYIIHQCTVAAMAPPYAVAADVPQDVLEKEKKFLTEQALESGKPLNSRICLLTRMLTTIWIVSSF